MIEEGHDNIEDIDLMKVKREDISESSVADLCHEEGFGFIQGMFTMKINGQYRKKMVDSGAMASFYDCYDGKKAGLICVFEVGDTEALMKTVKAKPGDETGVQIEVPLSKIQESIIDGEKFISRLLGFVASNRGFSEIDDPDEDELEDEGDSFGAFG